MTEDDKKKADAESGETLDKLLTGIDALASCMGAFGERLDAMNARMDAVEGKKPDDKRGEGENELVEREKPTSVAADSAERSMAIVDAQVRCDEVASRFGESAPKPMSGEDPLAYRRRVLRPFQRHSKEFATVDLYKIDGALLDGIEARIYADAAAAADRPEAWPEGRLRERKERDASGRLISTFHGNHSFVRQFKRPARHVRLNLASRQAS